MALSQLEDISTPERPSNVEDDRDALFNLLITELRAEYRAQPRRYQFWDLTKSSIDTILGDMHLWYGDAPYHYVHLVHAPGTLAAEIWSLKADIPEYGVNLEIIGDQVRHVPHKPIEEEEEEEEEDGDDCSIELAILPLITFNPAVHFAKPPRYRSEIQNLLRCKGSPYVVQLLGKTQDGRLVFPKFSRDMFLWSLSHDEHITVTNVKTFMLHLIDCVEYLHSVGIIHRDLVLRNLLRGEDTRYPVIIADVESRWTSAYCLPPEIAGLPLEARTISPATDVYAIGTCLKQFLFANNPRTPFVEHVVPPPFEHIYEVCTRTQPEDRPTLEQLRLLIIDV